MPWSEIAFTEQAGKAEHPRNPKVLSGRSYFKVGRKFIVSSRLAPSFRRAPEMPPRIGYCEEE